MDLADFDSDALYFAKPLSPVLEALLMQAAASFGTSTAELHLLRAFLLAPGDLRVLAALYRHYHTTHQPREAAGAADRLMAAAGEALGFPADWRQLDRRHLQLGVNHSIGLVRFYLLALKARAALGLRLKEVEMAREMLLKVRELDGADRLGVEAIITILDNGRRVSAGVAS